MTDQIPDVDQTPTDTTSSAAGGGSGWRAWLGKQDSHGRPMGVYLILAAGVLTLLLLMLTIYLWSGDRGREEQPICTAISGNQAQAAILDGQVDQFTLVYSSDLIETPESSGWGPVQARLLYSDGRCAYLPQGVSNQQTLYTMLGAITFYNETTVNARVEVKYSGLTALDDVLFETPAPVSTPTEIPPTRVVATPDVTATPSPTPTEIPATPDATPDGTPNASPAARLLPSVPPSPTPTEER